MKKALFHLHSNYSCDCLVKVDKIVNLAVRNNIDYLVICDHESLNGSLEARSYVRNKKLNLEIPVAAEYATDIGDIIAVNVPENFKKIYEHKELCKTVKSLGGSVILPHPYKGHKIDQIDFTDIDFIEVFNSRCTEKENHLAEILAKSRNKKNIFGSDAHFAKDIAKAIMAYDKDILAESPRPIKLGYTDKESIILAEMVKEAKKRDFIALFISLLRFAKYRILEALLLVKKTHDKNSNAK